MSSTSENAEAAARDFFRAVLSPLGCQLQASGVVLADVTPRRVAESYYEAVPPFGRTDFELMACQDPDTLGAALREQWQGDPRLQTLARKLAELSAKIGVEVEQTGDVSPFVYVMF